MAKMMEAGDMAGMDDNDTIRARQTDEMLQLAGQMVDLTQEGLDDQVAQAICELLLPNSAAIAVAITDCTVILGYAGYREAENPAGAPIRTQATHATIADGETRVMYTADDIGFPTGAQRIHAAIVVPLLVGRDVQRDIRGTLKFYFAEAEDIDETQKSIAQGFGKLLSTQIAAAELETQRELATSMELKMLQSQINPHFLFNTINTIASLIRTDPPKARELLREFAVFYRSTLEDSQDRIPLERELQQTARYFAFEVARFGEERLELVIDVDELPKGRGRRTADADGAGSQVGQAGGSGAANEGGAPDDLAAAGALKALEALEELEETGDKRAEEVVMVPPFLLQPLVENAVKHAMPSEGKLTVTLRVRFEAPDVLMQVRDDGVGMTEEERDRIMHPESQTGLGIAVKNVRDRLRGFFGPAANMTVESEPGVGTTITLRLPDIV